MSVASALLRERIRNPDGTRMVIAGGPSTGLTARALQRTGARALSASARAAVRGDVVEPHAEVRVKYETSSRLLPQLSGGGLPIYDLNSWAYQAQIIGGVAQTTPLLTSPRATFGGNYLPNVVGMGYRRNPDWRPQVLDETPLDTAQIGPSVDPNIDPTYWQPQGQRGKILAGIPMAEVPVNPLVRPVANPEAEAAGSAWNVAAGTYSRTSSPTLPTLGLPGTNAHRVSGTISAHSLTSPWVPCAYTLAVGREFTAAAWVTASVPGSTYRVVLEFRDGSASATYTLTGPAVVVDGPTRLAATMPVPSSLPYTLVAGSARVRVECVTAATGGTGTLDVRGAHYYAGTDRGDTEGLRAVPVPFTFSLGGAVLSPILVNRLDLHGVDGKCVTAAYAQVTDGSNTSTNATGWGGSPGRMTIRLSRTVPTRVYTTANPFGAATVYVEEVNTGPGGYLWLTSIEMSREADLTDRLVEMEVDRSLDSDPSDSTVPIGNYAATAGRVELDNTDRALSPMRTADADLGREIEVVAGVVYSNRHRDPLADGLDSTAWNGTLDVAPTDRDGSPPPLPRGARGGLVAGACVRVNPGERWRASAWLTTMQPGANPHYDILVVWSNSAGTILTQNIGTAPGNRWDWREMDEQAPAGASMLELRVSANGGTAWIVAPVFERIDVVTGRVTEVVEQATAGVFTSVDWPTATDSDTVSISLLDTLAGSRGSQAVAERLWTGVEAGVSIAMVAREYLDLGDDEVVVPTTSAVIPLTLPTTTAAQMIADLAKAGALTAYTDGTGRLVARGRDQVSATTDAEYREDNALIRAGLPFAPDLVRNVAAVTGHPVTFVPSYELATVANDDPTDVTVAGWKLSGQEIRVPYGGTVSLIVTWESDAALDAVVAVARGYRAADVGTVNPPRFAEEGTAGHSYTVPKVGGGSGGVFISDGSWVKTRIAVYPTFGRVTITFSEIIDAGLLPGDVLIDHIEIRGTAAIVGSVTQEFTRADSVEAYGRKPVAVDVRLGQDLGQLSVIGTDILDNYSLRDPSGERWLPDLEATVLGDPWRELGDRVLAREPDSGIGGEYRVVSHKIRVGQAMESEFYLRRVVTGVTYITSDVSTLDGPDVLGY